MFLGARIFRIKNLVYVVLGFECYVIVVILIYTPFFLSWERERLRFLIPNLHPFPNESRKLINKIAK